VQVRHNLLDLMTDLRSCLHTGWLTLVLTHVSLMDRQCQVPWPGSDVRQLTTHMHPQSDSSPCSWLMSQSIPKAKSHATTSTPLLSGLHLRLCLEPHWLQGSVPTSPDWTLWTDSCHNPTHGQIPIQNWPYQPQALNSPQDHVGVT